MSTALQLAKRKEIPINCVISTMLPHLLKTERTKEANIKEDYTKFIPLEKIAGLITMWSKGINRPDNGSFMEFKLEKSGHVFPYYL